MRRRKGSVRFTGRSHSKKGITACIIGILVILLLIVLAVLSGIEGGKGSSVLGLAAIIGFAVSAAGFIMSVLSLKEKDIYFTAPIVGLVSNGVMFIIFMILYIIGLM